MTKALSILLFRFLCFFFFCFFGFNFNGVFLLNICKTFSIFFVTNKYSPNFHVDFTFCFSSKICFDFKFKINTLLVVVLIFYS